jgi:hypothetical protein
MEKRRKSVVLTLRTLAKVTDVAREQGIPFSTALDALARLADAGEVERLLDADAGALASWRIHGDESEG